MAVIVITITGPVDMPSAVLLIMEPTIPLKPPKIADKIIIFLRFEVHCLAAAAGAISIETIRTTQTVFNPITTATTITDVNNALRYLIGNPRL